jgi:hypothetical protein
MKLPDVSGVYDYAGPNGDSRYRPRSCCLAPSQKRRRPDRIFSELNTQPACTPVYASPCISQYTTQNSGPSGSLLLSRRTLAFPASCRLSRRTDSAIWRRVRDTASCSGHTLCRVCTSRSEEERCPRLTLLLRNYRTCASCWPEPPWTMLAQEVGNLGLELQKDSFKASCTNRGLLTVEFTEPNPAALRSLTGMPNWG